MVAFVAVLALVPAIVTLSRQAHFTSRVEILGSSDPALREVEGTPGIGSLAQHVRRILDDPGLRQSILTNVGLSTEDQDVLNEMTVARGATRGGDSIVVHVSAGSAEQARDLALQVGKQTTATSTFMLVFAAGQQADSIERRLSSDALPPEARQEQRQERRSLLRVAKGLPLLSLGPDPVAATESRKAADRLLAAFPGALPPRPNAVVAGLAGLLLALAFCTLWLVVRAFALAALASASRAPDLIEKSP